MKILWIVPLTIPGNPFMVDEKGRYARALVDLGNEVYTVVRCEGKGRRLPGFTRVCYFTYGRPKLLYKILFHLRVAIELFRTKADVLLFGYSAGHFIPLAFALRYIKRSRRKTKIVLDVRTVPVDLEPNFRSVLNVLRYELALYCASLFCDGVTCITSFLQETIEKRFRRLKGKTHVLSTAADFSQLDPSQAVSLRSALGLVGKFVILYHGILSPNRGLQSVVRALAHIIEEMPDLVFMVVGDGPARDELSELARRLRIIDHVRLVGSVPYGDIPNYIASSNLGVLPMPKMEWWDLNSPIKLKEYLAMGLPVLATDLRSHRQVIELCGGGTLIPDASPESIKDGLLRFRKLGGPDYPQKSRRDLESLISYRAEVGRFCHFLRSL